MENSTLLLISVIVFIILLVLIFSSKSCTSSGGSDEYKSILSSTKHKPIITYYYTTWCPHCKNFKPIWNAVKNNNRKHVNEKEIIMVEVDGDKLGANDPPIRSFPTVLAKISESTVYKYNGGKNQNNLRDFVAGIIEKTVPPFSEVSVDTSATKNN